MKWPWTFKARNQLADFISDKYERRTNHLNSIESMRVSDDQHARTHLDERLDRLERRFDEVCGMIDALHREQRLVLGGPAMTKMRGMSIVEELNGKAKKQRKTRRGKK